MPGLEGVSGNEIEIHSHFFFKVRHVSASIKKKKKKKGSALREDPHILVQHPL